MFAGTIAKGGTVPDRLALVVTPAALADRVAEASSGTGAFGGGVKATAMLHVAPAARVAPLQVSELAVNWEPARDAIVGVTVVWLRLVTMKVVGGELVPAATDP